MTENVNLHVHDDTAEAVLGLWGKSAISPAASPNDDPTSTNPGVKVARGWKPGETVLLIQAPGWKIGRTVSRTFLQVLLPCKPDTIKTYLSLTSATVVDVDPAIPDADWLRKWSLRQKSRGSINPPFPKDVFEPKLIITGPIRCLFTIADLDDFARCSPNETFQGYLSLLIMEFKLFEYWKRHMLLSGECCSVPMHANATSAECKGCHQQIELRLNPRIIGQVIDETAAISGGRLLFSNKAWRDLLGHETESLLKLGYEEIKYLSDRVLFCRVTMLFGWTGDESKAGGRICIFGVRT